MQIVLDLDAELNLPYVSKNRPGVLTDCQCFIIIHCLWTSSRIFLWITSSPKSVSVLLLQSEACVCALLGVVGGFIHKLVVRWDVWQCTTGWLLQVKGATSSNRMSVGFIGAGQLAHALVKGFTAAGKATFSNLCLEVSDVKITHKWCLVGCGEQCSRSYTYTVSTFRSLIRPEQLHS